MSVLHTLQPTLIEHSWAPLISYPLFRVKNLCDFRNMTSAIMISGLGVPPHNIYRKNKESYQQFPWKAMSSVCISSKIQIIILSTTFINQSNKYRSVLFLDHCHKHHTYRYRYWQYGMTIHIEIMVVWVIQKGKESLTSNC